MLLSSTYLCDIKYFVIHVNLWLLHGVILILTLNICFEFYCIFSGSLSEYCSVMFDYPFGSSSAIDDGRNFCCPNCPRSYKYKHHLNRHLKYECGKEKQFRCNICRKAFSHNNQLKAHVINVHKQLLIPDWWKVSAIRFFFLTCS